MFVAMRLTPITAVLSLTLLLITRHSFAQDDGTCTSDDECMNGICDLDVNDTNDLNHINKVCHCTDDYIGPYCSERCLITCQNGGVCARREADEHGGGEVDSSDFICQCPPTYDGPLCATKRIDDAEKDPSSSPAAAPSTTDTEGSVPSSSTNGGTQSAASIGTILGIVVVAAMIVSILLWWRMVHSRRRTKQLKNDRSRTNAVSSGTNDLSISNHVTDAESIGDGKNDDIVIGVANNATIAMTNDGPQFVPDTTYSVKLHDVA